MNLVAVYGTLKKGKGNHHHLETSTLLGTGGTEPRFSMISFGGYPGVLNGDQSIHVEVYEVDDPKVMQSMDRLEGHPSFFEREETKITLDSGEEVEAWMYTVRKHGDYYTSPRYEETDECGRLAWRHDACSCRADSVGC